MRRNPYPKQAVALPLVQHAPPSGSLPVFTPHLDLHRGMPAERRIHRAHPGHHQSKVFLPYFPCRERLGKPHLASSVSATQISPEVSLSRRCTIPGRKPSCARRDGKRATSRWTSVPSGQLGAGCMVMARRFVEHGKPRILIEDLQFALFRLHGCRFRFHPEFNGLPGPHLGGDIRTHGPVNKTAAIPDGLFQFFSRTSQPPAGASGETVKPQFRLPSTVKAYVRVIRNIGRGGM